MLLEISFIIWLLGAISGFFWYVIDNKSTQDSLALGIFWPIVFLRFLIVSFIDIIKGKLY